MQLKTLVIWNPNSGRAKSAADIRKLLEEQDSTDVREPSTTVEVTQFVRQAAEDGCELVVAAGGDGTVNAVANAIVASGGDLTMAVLPIGTANDFAYTLGIPDELTQAYELLATGEVRSIDLVDLETVEGTHCFINVATGGNSDRVTENLTDELKQTWGALCYLRGAIGVLADLTSFQATVSFDDQADIELNLWNVIVANGRTNAGRLLLAPLASIEDGLMDIVLIRDGTVLDLASLAGQFLMNDYLRSEQVVFRQARSFAIRTNPPMFFSVDGEPLAKQPLLFRARPRALKVIVGERYLPTPP
jgi:diacylglycerol kinase (ATP)